MSCIQAKFLTWTWVCDQSARTLQKIPDVECGSLQGLSMRLATLKFQSLVCPSFNHGSPPTIARSEDQRWVSTMICFIQWGPFVNMLCHPVIVAITCIPPDVALLWDKLARLKVKGPDQDILFSSTRYVMWYVRSRRTEELGLQ